MKQGSCQQEVHSSATMMQVDHACLAIIAFSAGAELQMGDLRRIKKQAFTIPL